jgi:hypothetical protein
MPEKTCGALWAMFDSRLACESQSCVGIIISSAGALSDLGAIAIEYYQQVG